MARALLKSKALADYKNQNKTNYKNGIKRQGDLFIMKMNLHYCNGQVMNVEVPDSKLSDIIDSDRLPGFCIIRGVDRTVCVPFMQLQGFDFQSAQPDQPKPNGTVYPDQPSADELPF